VKVGEVSDANVGDAVGYEVDDEVIDQVGDEISAKAGDGFGNGNFSRKLATAATPRRLSALSNFVNSVVTFGSNTSFLLS
jgi:hypothetical protein